VASWGLGLVKLLVKLVELAKILVKIGRVVEVVVPWIVRIV
jgi:hypothetical protein